MFWGGSGSSVLGPQKAEHNKVPPANRDESIIVRLIRLT